LDDASLEPIFQAEWFRNLTSLDLTGNSFSDRVIFRLARSRVCSQLESLRISQRAQQQDDLHLESRGCRALAEADFSQLEHLELCRQGIDSDKIRDLLKSRSLTNLTTLDLSGNPLQDAGVTAIANCKVLENLRVLKLESCDFTNEGFRGLAQSPYLKNLEQLFLGGSRLNLGPLERIFKSATMENLRTLSFAGCRQFAEDDFTLLGRMDSLKNLFELDLSGQEMNLERVQKLISSPNLDDLAHLSWFRSPTAQRHEEAEALLHARWPGRCRV
jgi:Leucine-rich repeat (LRR) protein